MLRERKEVPYENPPDYRQMRAVAVVRTLTWGPGVKPPMTSKSPIGEGIPDTSYRCLGDRESLSVIFDLLSVLTRCELDVLSVQYRCADFMEEIDPCFATGSTTSLVEASWLRLLPTTNRSLESEDADALRELLCDWENVDGVAARALRRLASSVARAGRFRLEDSILDLSIAMEMMYSIDYEVTYKLGTRAGYFVGRDAGERKRIFDAVKRLYGRRSDIVHGRQTSRKDIEQAYSEGFEVAKQTLFKLLHTEISVSRNRFWDDLVMTGGCKLDTSKASGQ